MKKIAIYGKGGSGKSTVSAALSVSFAKRGLKVLHVGCDPKSDSTLTLTGGVRPPTLLELLSRGRTRPKEEEFMVKARLGITCIEAGGPEPGAGCGGRGIARMFELFEEIKLLQRYDFDAVMFDVLGDVVCGGFAAPLRYGFADRAFVVVSEEPLSLYAANNILRALVTYSVNGVSLGGLIVNLSDNAGSLAPLHRFARASQSAVTGIIPRDIAIQEAELKHLTASDLPESSETYAAFQRLADAVLISFDDDPPLPTPLTVDELFSLAASSRPAKAVTPRPNGDGSGSATGRSGCADEPSRGVGSGDAAASPGAVPAAPRRSLPSDASVVGSPSTRKAFFELLGLGVGALGRTMAEVDKVVYARGAFHVFVSSPVLSDVALVLRKVGDTGQSFCTVGDVAVGYTSKTTPRSSRLIELVAAHLKSAPPSFERLTEILVSDASSEVEPTVEESRNRVMRTARPTARHWTIWGRQGTKGKFFFPEERSRLVKGEIRVRDNSINIHHGTLSCQASEQPNTPYSTHFVRYPWRADDLDHSHADQAAWLFTNLNDYELIAGTNKALSDALDWAAKQEGNRPVCVDVSCVPVISGEDWQGVLRRFKSSYPGPVSASAISGTDISAQVATLLMTLITELESAPVERVPHSVSLLGFPPTMVTRDLVKLLEVAGVTVVQQQVPAISIRGLPDFLRAQAQLAWPIEEYRTLYDASFRKLNLPFQVVVPPFGVDGTLAFVRQAAVAAGVGADEALARVKPDADEAVRQLEPLKARARELRLGMALQSNQADLLGDPDRTCGVPVVPFLDSLGFKTEVLVESDSESRLAWWLQSGLSAVYSDLWHDRRLLSAGLGHFSLADMEPGFAGAIRTAHRLLSIATSPFYKRFAHHTAGRAH